MARPTKLTEELTASICGYIRSGTPVTVACACVGISRDTFYAWLKTRQGFATSVKIASAQSEAAYVSLIAEAAKVGVWQAAAWMLERHPGTKERWRRKDVITARKAG